VFQETPADALVSEPAPERQQAAALHRRCAPKSSGLVSAAVWDRRPRRSSRAAGSRGSPAV